MFAQSHPDAVAARLDQPYQAADFLRLRLAGRQVKTVIILGSGLADMGDLVEDSITFSYDDIPGFTSPAAPGHVGELVIGSLGGHPVAVLKGKIFSHEETGIRSMVAPIRSLRLLGAQTLLYSASTGSLDTANDVGSLVLVEDHLNLMGNTPLHGKNDDRFGPHFPDMADAYDSGLRKTMLSCAASQGVKLTPGVYAAVLGPSFETPAEVRMLKLLGATVVGQSLVPDVMIARHCGMRVVAIANNTNLAVGISPVPVDHDQTLRGAAEAKTALAKILPAFLDATR